MLESRQNVYKETVVNWLISKIYTEFLEVYKKQLRKKRDEKHFRKKKKQRGEKQFRKKKTKR